MASLLDVGNLLTLLTLAFGVESVRGLHALAGTTVGAGPFLVDRMALSSRR